MILEGGLSVKAAMLAGRRKVEEIILDDARHDKDAHFIEQKAKELGIPVTKTTRENIDALAAGRTHGGVIAKASERSYQNLEDCFGTEVPYLALVEGVEDPFNLGYVMRSLYSSGCQGIILRARDWSRVESTILKSSAGASEYMNIVMMDPSEAVLACKKRNVFVYAAMRKDAISYFQADFTQPILLCIGGEMRGLSAKVLKEADQNIYIPYANDFRAALNAAGASSALGFEVMRQRSVE